MQGSCVPANGRRFTPACAGKSTLYTSALDRYGNHPRVRGEERERARRLVGVDGITPACAGKSTGCPTNTADARNHPRVRGEESNENAAFEGMDIPLSANFSFFFGTSFECRVIPERGARRLFGCQASGLATCYASRIQEQTIGCFTGVHCLYPTSRSLRNGTEYNRAES